MERLHIQIVMPPKLLFSTRGKEKHYYKLITASLQQLSKLCDLSVIKLQLSSRTGSPPYHMATEEIYVLYYNAYHSYVLAHVAFKY